MLLLGDLAWKLVHVEDEALRDPERAIELAERAVDVSDRNDYALVMLASCLHKVGRLAEAVEIAEEAASKSVQRYVKDLAAGYRRELDAREKE